MDFAMKSLSCNTRKGKTIVPATPLTSCVATFHTPIHSVHSYVLSKNKGSSRRITNLPNQPEWKTSEGGSSRRITNLPNQPELKTSEGDSAIWRQYGIETGVKSKQLSTMQDAKTQDQSFWSWINILAFVFFFTATIVCGLRFLQMYNASLYHIHYLEDTHLELTTQLSSQTSTLSSLTTWIYKAELEIKSLKRSLHQVQTELTAVKKEMTTRVGEELRTSVGRKSNHFQLDVLAELLGPSADFAAQKNGGSILATPDTETFSPTKVVTNMFGLNFHTSIRTTPSTILMGVLQSGECWAFHGSIGRVVILLARPIQVSAISIEHIPEALSINGNIDSAPRYFQLIGTTKEMTNEVFLGNFEYHNYGPSRQTFYVNTMELLNMTTRLFEAVEVRFLSNYGNQDYTCIYRVRIHGTS